MELTEAETLLEWRRGAKKQEVQDKKVARR